MSESNTLFAAFPDPILLIDPDGTLLAINSQAQKQLRNLQRDLIGTCVWDLYPHERVNHLRMLVRQTHDSRNMCRFAEKSGESWNEVTLLPIETEGGIQVAICSRDITRQIAAEEKLKQLTLQLINVQEDERQRISQDLHDEIGQSMTALMLQLKNIEGELAIGRNGIQKQIREVIRSVEAIMKNLRQVFYQLHPPSLETLPLSQALEAFCRTYSQQTGLHVDFSSDPGVPPVPDLQATALYRLVQEGLNNATKHARASSVWVNLDYAEGEVSVSIEDNGQGFNPQQISRNIGLSGVRTRFLMLNGTFDLDSALGKGTRLFGSLPLGSKG